jgi:hypothetical protein
MEQAGRVLYFVGDGQADGGLQIPISTHIIPTSQLHLQ